MKCLVNHHGRYNYYGWYNTERIKIYCYEVLQFNMRMYFMPIFLKIKFQKNNWIKTLLSSFVSIDKIIYRNGKIKIYSEKKIKNIHRWFHSIHHHMMRKVINYTKYF